jgi:hypothetical protein
MGCSTGAMADSVRRPSRHCSNSLLNSVIYNSGDSSEPDHSREAGERDEQGGLPPQCFELLMQQHFFWPFVSSLRQL